MAKFKIFGIGKDIGDRPTVKLPSATGFKSALYSGGTSGYEKMAKNLDIAIDQLQHALAAAMYDESVKIMNKSQKLVPVRDEVLIKSALVKPPRTLKRPETSLSYNTAYALRQHEEHSTKSKYLERPMNDAAKNMSSRLKRGVKKHAKKGTKITSLKVKRYG